MEAEGEEMMLGEKESQASKERRPLPETGKGKEIDCPLESPEGTRPDNTLVFVPYYFWISDLQKYKRLNLF